MGDWVRGPVVAYIAVCVVAFKVRCGEEITVQWRVYVGVCARVETRYYGRVRKAMAWPHRINGVNPSYLSSSLGGG